MSLIVCGADPSIRALGLAIVDRSTRTIIHVETVRSDTEMSNVDRYRLVFARAQRVLLKFKVQALAVEEQTRVHVGGRERRESNHSNSKTLIVVGAVMGAAFSLGIAVLEPTPQRAKKSVTGSGNAKKDQVKRAVERMNGAPEFFSKDAADAVAVACAPSLVEIAAALRGPVT